MAWFLRKSLRLGPLRLNLSKRGLGASVGVTGARLGVDATGKPYAAGGRYGFYFRKRLGPYRGDHGPDASHAAPAPAAPQREPRWWLLVVLALLLGLVAGVLLARAEAPSRVALFNAQGRRTGSAVVNREAARVEFAGPSE
jgi:hypothetical protein